MAEGKESDAYQMNTEELIAKAWYLKQYLSQLEKLLIEEQCHTSNDSKAFKQLLDLVERDTPKKVLDTRYKYDDRGEMFFIARCPSCGDDIFNDALFCECGQRLDWSEK